MCLLHYHALRTRKNGEKRLTPQMNKKVAFELFEFYRLTKLTFRAFLKADRFWSESPLKHAGKFWIQQTENDVMGNFWIV